MNLNDLFTNLNLGNLSVLFVLILSLIQISPIQINPWSIFGKWVQKQLSLDEIKDDLMDARRTRIIRFDDELIEVRPHRKDMFDAIEQVRLQNDSIGGIIQTAIVGLPVGLGQPWFSSVEGKIANALFSIGGIKGVEFGAGFDFSNMFGSTANDELYVENNIVKTKTNNNGGINGGITNGMPVVFNSVVKPTPSISRTQNSVDLKSMENVEMVINGRHDPAIIRRVAVVIDSITALVISDLLITRYGEDFLS